MTTLPTMRTAGQLEAELEPATVDDIRSAVQNMLASFPLQDAGDQNLETRAQAYAIGLAGVSRKGLREACRKWLQGEGADGNENFSFAPSPAQLRRLANIHDDEIRGRASRAASHSASNGGNVYLEAARAYAAQAGIRPDALAIINRDEHPSAWDAWRAFFRRIGKRWAFRRMGEPDCKTWTVPETDVRFFEDFYDRHQGAGR